MQDGSRNPVEPPGSLIPKVLNECEESLASHHRNSSLLLRCARRHRAGFTPALLNAIRPALLIQKAGSPADTVLRFFKTFLGVLVAEGDDEAKGLMEEIVGLFSEFSLARYKTVRANVTKVLSEVLNSLPGSFSLSDDVIVIVREFLHMRMDDRVAAIRAWAARALKRIVTFEEDGGVNVDTTIELFREKMKTETSAEVREAIVCSFPESGNTIPDILDRTRDVSERVRAAAYSSFADRFFPLESFSIRQRVQLLSHGLDDRSAVVRAACSRLVCVAWLTRDCEGDLVQLLRHLDVESHEAAAEAAVREVLRAHSEGCAEMELMVPCDGLRAAVKRQTTPGKEGSDDAATELLEVEEALFWRMLCLHLAAQAQESGANAATSAGAAAVVAAEAASDLNAQVESLLPATAHDYLTMLERHMQAGGSGRFAARQLMQLSSVLDFTDATIRAQAAALIHSLLVGGMQAGLEGEAEAEGEWEEGVADGKWGEALLGFAQRVHASDADVLAALVDAVADVSAPLMAGVGGEEGSGQGGSGMSEGRWLRCVRAVLLALQQCSKAPGGGVLRAWRGLRVEPQEVLNCIIVPAASHPSPLVRVEAIKGIHLFTVLHAPSARQHLPLLHAAARDASLPALQLTAVKALLDLLLWHKSVTLLPDAATGMGWEGDEEGGGEGSAGVASGREKEILGESSLEVLLALVPMAGGQVDMEEVRRAVEEAEEEVEEEDEKEGVLGVLCEGFCKLLLADATKGGKVGAEGRDEGRVQRLLQLLVQVYLCPGAAEDELPRTRQMLAELFNRIALLPACKVAASRLLLPMLRQAWPRKATAAARQPAVRASQLLLSIILGQGGHGVVNNTGRGEGEEEGTEEGEAEGEGEGDREGAPSSGDGGGDGGRASGASESSASQQAAVGFESLALDLAAEVLSSPLATSGSASGKAYGAHLVQLLVELPLRSQQQDDIKCLRSLLPMVAEAVAGQRTAERLVERMEERLRAMDTTPDEELPLERLADLLQPAEGDGANGCEGACKDACHMEGGSPVGRRRRSKQPGSAVRSNACEPEPATPSQPSVRPRRQSKEVANSRLKQQLQGGGSAARTGSARRRAVREADEDEAEEGVAAVEGGGEQAGSEGGNREAQQQLEGHSSGSEEGSGAESGSESEEYDSGSGSEEEYVAPSTSRQRGRGSAAVQSSAARRGSSGLPAVRGKVGSSTPITLSTSTQPAGRGGRAGGGRPGGDRTGGGRGRGSTPISISTDSDSDVVEVLPGEHASYGFQGNQSSRGSQDSQGSIDEEEVVQVVRGRGKEEPEVSSMDQRTPMRAQATAGGRASAAAAAVSAEAESGSSSPALSSGSDTTSFASALSADLPEPTPMSAAPPAATLAARAAARQGRRLLLDEESESEESGSEGWNGSESEEGSDEDSGSSRKVHVGVRGRGGEEQARENMGVRGKAYGDGAVGGKVHVNAAAGGRGERRQPLGRLPGQ